MSKAPKLRQASAPVPTLPEPTPFVLERSVTHDNESSESKQSLLSLSSMSDEQRRAVFWAEALKSLNLPFARKGTESYDATMKEFKKRCIDYENQHFESKSHDELARLSSEDRKRYFWTYACLQCGSRPRVNSPEYEDVMAVYIKLIHAYESSEATPEVLES